MMLISNLEIYKLSKAESTNKLEINCSELAKLVDVPIKRVIQSIQRIHY